MELRILLLRGGSEATRSIPCGQRPPLPTQQTLSRSQPLYANVFVYFIFIRKAINAIYGWALNCIVLVFPKAFEVINVDPALTFSLLLDSETNCVPLGSQIVDVEYRNVA